MRHPVTHRTNPDLTPRPRPLPRGRILGILCGDGVVGINDFITLLANWG